MSIIIIIGIIIVILIAILLVAALFTKNEYIIERGIIINKPKEEVFTYIKYLENQVNYNKWVMTDPGMKKEYKGTDGTVGFIYAWDSNNKQVGKGEQEIKKITGGERVDCEIRFIKPFEGTSYASIVTTSMYGPAGNEDHTKVIWIFTGVRNYMMKMVHLLFNLKKMLEKDIETSLTDLKTVLEK